MTELQTYDLVRLRVFQSGAPQSGNPLAIAVGSFDNPRLVADRILAAEELNQVVILSEPPRTIMRIFTPTAELPFSGQPALGVLHLLRIRELPMIIETGVGPVRGLVSEDVDWLEARPEWAPPMQICQLGSAAEVEALRGAPADVGYYYPWAWIDENAGTIRARMFAPGLGIEEGQASGAAVVRLAAEIGRDITVQQGRNSTLYARYGAEGNVWLGGRSSIVTANRW